jgi:hydrogenase maturation protein HypF
VRIFHFEHGLRGRSSPADPTPVGQRIEIRGAVQGVGFRPWVYRIATATGIGGRVRNHTAGVRIDAFGPASRLEAFLNTLATTSPDAAHIDEILTEAIPFEPVSGFDIVESETRVERRVSIPPDLPLCLECARELRDPKDRRHGYAFTNCTSCGPRFTIATGAPYDRPNTTMAGFRMCRACQREYDSVEDRRFHAQPNACPACGPSLALLRGDGTRLATADPLGDAAAALASGRIVALKGIGGFHLACDATSTDAVVELRRRKRRDEKPFAVMARDLRVAQRLCALTSEEERLLLSVERPIVLADRREPSQLSSAIAPFNPLVGIFLPYSPLHQLLLDRVDRPLVMTSGNVSDEPLAYTDEEALERLGEIADLFLVHNRDIVTRCDDSVAHVVAGAPMVLRRSRGYVPRPIRLARPIAEPVLACGAMLKNTFCFARGHEACLGPHIGDLENLETYRAYSESIARMERFLDFKPAIIAHDLHPDYLSTTYAIARHDALVTGVQHHHAHIASVMAEHGLDGPVIGVAYDGTGLGTDGTAWGGEILVAGYSRFERVGTFRPIALAGGDTAIRQPWRAALALIDDAFGGDPPIDSLPLFRQIPRDDIDVVLQLIRQGVNAPKAHGVGRYFDAMGAIGLARPVATYEGQIALEWNVVAAAGERGRYRYEIDRSTPTCCILDLRQSICDAIFELIGGEPASRVSARFHNTLAAATVELVRCVARKYGHLPVALSGGCFQNRRLTESVLAGLAPDFTGYVHRSVPPGDGGLSLGQAVVADALAKGI